MALSRRDDLLSYISDAHKDAYGSRPALGYYVNMSIAELEAAADRLSDAVAEAIEEERKWELEARARWEAAVDSAIASGAGNRENAVRWLLEAEGFDEFDLWYGDDFINFRLGVGYDYDLLSGEERPNRDFNYDAVL